MKHAHQSGGNQVADKIKGLSWSDREKLKTKLANRLGLLYAGAAVLLCIFFSWLSGVGIERSPALAIAAFLTLFCGVFAYLLGAAFGFAYFDKAVENLKSEERAG